MVITLMQDIVWRLDDVLVDTHFESNTRQLFEVDNRFYVYFKNSTKLFRITSDTYFNLLIKLSQIKSVINPLHHVNRLG